MAPATTLMVPAEEGRQAGWGARGRWRPRPRREASEPTAFLLLKQVGEGVAKARQGCGVRHVGAERRERAGDVVDGDVPVRCTGCGAWPN